MVLLSLAAAAALIANSYLLLLAGILLTVSHNVWAWRHVELFPIGADEARTAARASGLIALVLLVLRVFSP